MTNALTAAECLERARMHEQLAVTTADSSARMMHQAMAAEFRRRAEAGTLDTSYQPSNKPMAEFCAIQ
ncbi:hypothetical protein PX699_04900 [Sphingobium sp. H39-3-25]|uniref:hypothetical protein n=1 Tax=Sphingobium arseniciresistens TaxID=3030834 RepID=UPI0023B9C3F0|nr:hypothetical protein [Sphingobium arseniciresistens]